MIKNLIASTDILSLNRQLTKLMASKQIQAVLSDGGVEKVINHVVQLAKLGDAKEKMKAVASLGRLAAVIRGNKEIAFTAATALLQEPPEALTVLTSADERLYFVNCLANNPNIWVLPYCIEALVNEEVSEKTRSMLVETCLNRSSDIATLLSMISAEFFILDMSSDSRFTRARRILNCLNSELSRNEYLCGETIGKSIKSLAKTIFKNPKDSVEPQKRHDVIDGLLGLVLAVVRFQFSLALRSDTFEVLAEIRSWLGKNTWGDYLVNSATIVQARTCLLESSLILARQNRTDDEFMSLLVLVFGDKGLVRRSLKKRLINATDLEVNIRNWWISAGSEKNDNEQREQKLDISVDHQIGAALIEVEAAKDAMGKLSSDIVPLLEISDPVLAPVMKRAHASYIEIDRVMKQLAKMRRLELVQESGKTLEYNPSQHEMIGTTQIGIRHVRVIRNGVQKDFDGKIKTILKCWVEPT
jgi:hypothetical protein